jgi:hypothetical protein
VHKIGVLVRTPLGCGDHFVRGPIAILPYKTTTVFRISLTFFIVDCTFYLVFRSFWLVKFDSEIYCFTSSGLTKPFVLLLCRSPLPRKRLLNAKIDDYTVRLTKIISNCCNKETSYDSFFFCQTSSHLDTHKIIPKAK